MQVKNHSLHLFDCCPVSWVGYSIHLVWWAVQHMCGSLALKGHSWGWDQQECKCSCNGGFAAVQLLFCPVLWSGCHAWEKRGATGATISYSPGLSLEICLVKCASVKGIFLLSLVTIFIKLRLYHRMRIRIQWDHFLFLYIYVYTYI